AARPGRLASRRASGFAHGTSSTPSAHLGRAARRHCSPAPTDRASICRRQAGGRAVAFPGISTSIDHGPAPPAAAVAVVTVRDDLAIDGALQVIFACFDASTLAHC